MKVKQALSVKHDESQASLEECQCSRHELDESWIKSYTGDTKMIDLDLLKVPFPENKIHWRVGATTSDKSKGIALAYIDARDVMERLDDVLGIGGWQDRYPFEGCCEIGIMISGEWVWKANGAGKTSYEGEKGQYSDSFKRAAVVWGIGRYLYALPNEWVAIKQAGKSYKITGKPALPCWATPDGYQLSIAFDKAEKAMLKHLSNKDAEGLKEVKSEFDIEEMKVLWDRFTSSQRSEMKRITAEQDQ